MLSLDKQNRRSIDRAYATQHLRNSNLLRSITPALALAGNKTSASNIKSFRESKSNLEEDREIDLGIRDKNKEDK
ncbi:hypothetical protein HBI58_185940 [Parastagonospora nodorum]|nr:hypothetical protein HBI58_185940 [Parastagonospora nodorum]